MEHPCRAAKGYYKKIKTMTTAIIDYGTGNLRSVENALRRTGADYVITSDADTIIRSDRVILPGVGEASSAMQKLRSFGLDRLIPDLKQPVLGICIGMQLMCSFSEEGDTAGLGIFHTAVRKLTQDSTGPKLKIPEMGWNTIRLTGQCSGTGGAGLFEGIDSRSYVYYVHSYAPDICPQTAAVTEYGREFSAALAKDNFFGTQFHPEKSGKTGERIIDNFIKMDSGQVRIL